GQQGSASALAYRMANASELLHFMKQDRDISLYSVTAQDKLADVVHSAFKYLTRCLQRELEATLPTFLDDTDQDDDGSAINPVLSTLASAMALLRRCRVNAALTIQLFSQLFHFINMWLFNK
ncbi:PREDICTED: afadin-like, partial [Priapulus caudatus]|uniref:Afadin-like n=1 Tax=Priapulus caudatus TaxID=37621 RepID=A0ABM1F6D2_PRICU